MTMDTDDLEPIKKIKTIDFDDLSIQESASSGEVTVALNQQSAKPIKVTYSTQNGSANEEDYFIFGESITFAPGEVSKSIALYIRENDYLQHHYTL